jgi:lysophospholipase L1-like esterase
MLSASLTFVLFLFFTSLFSFTAAHQVPLQPNLVTRFPWIHTFASIGDSYASGLGAGTRLDWSCSRYSSSYPHILYTSLFGADDARVHQFLACSGSSTSMILADQIPKLQDDSIDLLTISAGGNDIGLTPVLNSCVYQFYMAGEAQCEDAIQEARSSIEDPARLYTNITAVLEASKFKLGKDGVIVVTGYARFFGTEDKICDNVTWAVWSALEYEKQYLRQQMRTALNSLVSSTNDVLRNATKAAGPRVLFVDYDADIEKARGRYCEPNVQEPEPNRLELAFYEWNTVDKGENSTELQQQPGDNVPRGSFESEIAESINKTLHEHPEWKFDPDKGFVDKDQVGEDGIFDGIGDGIHWMLPDSWKRVFHLRPAGHAIVAKRLVEVLQAFEERRKDDFEDEVNEL